MENIEFRLADRKDSDNILNLLHSMKMPGEIELLYKKNPDFFHAAEIQGYAHQTLVAYRENGEIVALGTRALKKAYLNGVPESIGYLGDLRISQEARHMRILARGYSEMGKLMRDGQARLHLTTIIEGNRNAKIALTWKNKSRTIPNYFDIGRINTSFIFPVLWKKRSNAYQIRRGNIRLLDEITDFINTIAPTRQFYPAYSQEDFLKLRGFSPDNFYLAYSDNQLIGVVGLWNQTGFKQLEVIKYNGKMALLKRCLGRILPEENAEIPHAYIAFIAIKNNDDAVLRALLSHVYCDARKSGLKYIVIGFHENDPLQKAVRLFPRLNYKSRLYIADYKEDAEISDMLDDRIPYVEVATL